MTEADAVERLEAMRAELDRIDADLVELLGRRFRTIRDVAEHKRLTGIAVMQPSRVEEVVATRLQRAREAGLDPKLVERLWTTIITHACQVENVVGGIEGGELLFQGVSLDHGRIEVDDLDAACEMICQRLSFDRVEAAGQREQGPRCGDPEGRGCHPSGIGARRSIRRELPPGSYRHPGSQAGSNGRRAQEAWQFRRGSA